MTEVTILDGKPVVEIIASMKLDNGGLDRMAQYYQNRRPDCVALEGGRLLKHDNLLPHNAYDQPLPVENVDPSLRRLSDNERLCEIAGRSCYASFGEKSGRKTNLDYLRHIQDLRHLSVLYHAKITFFIAGISRRVSHELIRTYVGADRTEEGSPSQESTRFTHHTGCFVQPPYIKRLKDVEERAKEEQAFRESCRQSYESYLAFVERRIAAAQKSSKSGKGPFGLKRKRIYEAASGYLHHSCETSFVWTTNPVALLKQFMERIEKSTDLEYRRLVAYMMDEAWKGHRNLFPAVVGDKLEEARKAGVFDL